MKKNLYILAPNDRFNYGDLIFSKVLLRYFQKDVDNIIFCSTTTADLTDRGGDSVLSSHVLYKPNKCEENYLIVAGGECMLQSWFVIMQYVNNKVYLIEKLLRTLHIHNRFTNHQIIDLMSWIIRKVLGYRTFYPFSVGKCELPYFKGVYYNSLGGSWLKEDNKILRKRINRNILNSVDYISVRDLDTKEALSSVKIDSIIIPDCAILMSEYFDNSFLTLNSSVIDEYNLSRKTYIFFQINVQLEKRFHKEVQSILSKLISDSYHIVLCPIGTALGHDDDVALKNITNELHSDSLTLVDKPSLWDIMTLINNATCYIGSSLHGIITSMSYETPFIGYNVSKVKAYINMWAKDQRRFHYTDNLLDIPKMINTTIRTAYTCQEQKEIVKQSLDRIKSMICQ